MKLHLILAMLLALLLAACAQTLVDTPSDFSLVLEWDSGPLPPQYRYQYTIAIGPGPQGELTYFPGYEATGENLWVSSFELSQAELDALFRYLSENDLMRSDWQTVQPLIGGKATRITLTAYGRQYPVPNIAELDEEDRASVEAAVSFINRFIPDESWQEMEDRQERYEQSFTG